MALDVSQLTRPGADPTVARNTSRAQDLVVSQIAGQQQAGGLPPTSGALFSAAAGATQQVGQQVLKQAAGEVAALKGQTSDVVQENALASSTAVGQGKLQQQKVATQNEATLAGLDASTKKKLLDDQMSFGSQVAGEGVLQTSQLADWAIMKATDQNQLAAYAQQVQDATQKNIEVQQAGYNAMAATLKAASAGQIQGMDEATQLQVTQAQNAFKLAWDKAIASQQGVSGMLTAGGTVVGAVVGGVYGGPAGAVAGGAVGGAVGSLAGNALSSQSS